jgi:hypothetical protein
MGPFVAKLKELLDSDGGWGHLMWKAMMQDMRDE